MQNLLLLYLTGRFKMVRNYVRKTTRKAVGQDVLQLAKDDLQAGNSIRSVAAKYGMDESTLRKRMKKVS
jgi:transposase-like protein